MEDLCEWFFFLAAKKDVRVKALEAAEAAKRLEEKKQIEREMRKAAAKLEREKIKKERIKAKTGTGTKEETRY
jgi:hypothetical protein